VIDSLVRALTTPAWAQPAHAVDLRDQVGVDVHRVRQDPCVVALAQVGAGDADLLRQEVVRQRVLDLSGCARVDAYRLGGARRSHGTHDGKVFRLALRLLRDAHPSPHAGSLERGPQAHQRLTDMLEIPDVERCAVPVGELKGIAAGDRETAVRALEAGPRPPGDLVGSASVLWRGGLHRFRHRALS
jgi:hypothetical protein